MKGDDFINTYYKLHQRITIIVIAILVINSFHSVFANISATLIRNNDALLGWTYKYEIKISLAADFKEGGTVTILTLYPGKKTNDLDDIPNMMHTIKYIDIQESSSDNQNNSISFYVPMEDSDPSGNYSFISSYIKDGGYVSEGSRFFYVSLDDRVKYVGYFNDSALNGTEVINLLTKNLKYYNFIGFNYLFYSKYISVNQVTKDLFASSMISNRPQTGYDQNLLVDVFNKSSQLIALNRATDSSQLRSIIEDINIISKELIYKNTGDFSTLPDSPEGKEYVYNYLFNLKNKIPFTAIDNGVNTLIKAFNTATAFVKINIADETEVEKLIDSYFELLGISKMDYEFYKNNSAVKIEVNKYISSKDFEKPEDIGDTFSKKINELKLLYTNKSNSSNRGVHKITIVNPSPSPSPALPVNNEKTVFMDLTGFDWAKESIKVLSDDCVINGMGNNLFKPNDNVTREQFIKMLVCGMNINADGKEPNFIDVSENDWFYPYVSAAFKKGIILGSEDNYFKVGEYITRQDMAVIVDRAMLLNGVKFESLLKRLFVDNDKVFDYCADSVKKLAGANIIKGNDRGEFLPLDFATRAQAAVIIYRVINCLAK